MRRNKGRQQKIFTETSPPLRSSDYSTGGYFISPRKNLWGPLAKNRVAYVLYDHLVGSANFKDGRFKRGQLPMSEKDFARRLGWSITTVREGMRWLEAHGYIETLRIPRVGVVVTIVNYDSEQDFTRYAQKSAGSATDPGRESAGSAGDPQMTRTGSPTDPVTRRTGSVADPSVFPHQSDLLLLLATEPFSVYFGQCPPKKREKERGVFEDLLNTYDPSEIAAALEYVLSHKVPARSGELEVCRFPMAYLAHQMDWVLEAIEAKRKSGAHSNFVPPAPQEEKMSLEQLAAAVARAEVENPMYAGAMRRQLEKRLRDEGPSASV